MLGFQQHLENLEKFPAMEISWNLTILKKLNQLNGSLGSFLPSELKLTKVHKYRIPFPHL